VCVRAGRLGCVRWSYFSKIGDNINKFFIVLAEFYFKYFSQFKTEQSARKFHSLSIHLLSHIVSFYSENKLYFRKFCDLNNIRIL
jgi:hypothetical protein